MSHAAPGSWRLTGLFLALILLFCLPFMLGVTMPDRMATPASLILPVSAAAIAGMWWRSRLPAQPDWATRRPVSRLMALSLMVVYIAIALVAAYLLFAHMAPDDPAGPAAFPGLLRQLGPENIAMMIPSVLFLALTTLIQTEIGLFLGTLLMGRILSYRDGTG